MEKNIENKAIKTQATKEIFSFPEYGEAIEAESQDQAREILMAKLASKKSK
jgi:hypothetical protein